MLCRWFDHHNKKNLSGAEKFVHIVVWVIVGILAAAVFATIFAFIVQWLWNSLMPDIFGLGTINYWQALGIIVLSRLLFGGINSHDRDEKKKSSRDNHHDDCCGELEQMFSDHHGVEAKNEDYHRYWEDEGKKAFQEWLRKKENNETPPGQ